MPLLPGNDTVVFDLQTYDGTPGKYNVVGPVSHTHTVVGCFVQPISVSDNLTDTTYSDATTKCIAPSNDVTLAAQSEDKILFQGLTYRIVGTKAYRDFWGRNVHVTFICKEQEG